jgi:hypothetical protein
MARVAEGIVRKKEPVAPLPPLLSDDEIAKRAVWVKCTDGQRVHLYHEGGGHLAIRVPWGPPAFVQRAEIPKVKAFLELEPLPDKCAHGHIERDCLQCKPKVA